MASQLVTILNATLTSDKKENLFRANLSIQKLQEEIIKLLL